MKPAEGKTIPSPGADDKRKLDPRLKMFGRIDDGNHSSSSSSIFVSCGSEASCPSAFTTILLPRLEGGTPSLKAPKSSTCRLLQVSITKVGKS